MKLTFYDILNVTPESTPEEIKKAFRGLSIIHHPDKGGDHEEFNTILKAYETLSDPILKAEYDLYGTDKVQILNIAMTIFKDVMSADPADISETLKCSKIEDMIQIDRTISGLQKGSDKLDKTLSRVKEAPAYDFIKESLETEKANIRLQIEQFKENKSLTESAYGLLSEYSFENRERKPNKMIINNRSFPNPVTQIV